MEHLETDVMRFMAILAFCLVAIFALVQSVPQSSRRAEPVSAPATPVPEPRPAAVTGVEQPVAVDRTQVVETVVASPPPPTAPPPVSDPPVPAALPEAVAAATEEPAPLPLQESADEPVPEPVEAPPPPRPAKKGFSLRFDSDAALVGLVERNEVHLYAFARDRVWQFMIVDGRPTFRSAQAPGQYHAMAPATVPGPVVDSLRRSVVLPPGGVKWGVTLPPPTAAVLNRVLATADGGDLVIDADGYLHVEEQT